jgi:hypothetical protein
MARKTSRQVWKSADDAADEEVLDPRDGLGQRQVDVVESGQQEDQPAHGQKDPTRSRAAARRERQNVDVTQVVIREGEQVQANLGIGHFQAIPHAPVELEAEAGEFRPERLGRFRGRDIEESHGVQGEVNEVVVIPVQAHGREEILEVDGDIETKAGVSGEIAKHSGDGILPEPVGQKNGERFPAWIPAGE